MIKAGIVGGTGYTAGELLRLLLNHKNVEVSFVVSTSSAGKPVTDFHTDLLGSTDLVFSSECLPEADVVFLCLGHGHSKTFLSKNTFSKNTRIIDLSADFRLDKDQTFQNRTFVYGLPELHKTQIKNAMAIANPGCFATAIQLALLPLAKNSLLQDPVHIQAITGSTGAGGSMSTTSHFSWRNQNVSWYKPFTHQHLGEIQQNLKALQKEAASLHFLPIRGNFTRGIFATAYTRYTGSLEEAKNTYKQFYREAAFCQVSENEIHLKQVVNTNQCHLHIYQHENTLLVTSVIDNLLKGASGQAVQNMNLMFGIQETEGLSLKSSVF
ncbi:N-acetyl-gamma-glutamyl-phosphate reductase [Ascidiimonas aurantiaca]|uniref:N-acetyl-gamma-glutamyl-phosphate reductase n=1 Tax=Ascidiimonas aurantiaca TaxID=1685432 RepID=UPI0030EC7F1D